MQMATERRLAGGRRILAAGVLIVAGAVGLASCGGSGSGDADAGASGSLSSFIGDSHVHSLMVDRADPRHLLVGLHAGLFSSTDGGRSWEAASVEGDAMNLATAAKGAPLWVAGHEILERSDDGGATWESMRPEGLPGLDIHGFAVRPGQPAEVFAAVAGQGLYRSTDGGASFRLVSREVGPTVFGLAITPDGTLFAADPASGLLISSDDGRTFRAAVQGQGIVSVTSVPSDPRLVLAAGDPGIIVSRDGGDLWSSSFADGPIAAVSLDPSGPRRAFAVGVDGTVYETRDAARGWVTVEQGA